MAKQNLIVKLSGCRSEGRSVDGEYGGGQTMRQARSEAAFFATACEAGRISIHRVTPSGDLALVEVYRA